MSVRDEKPWATPGGMYTPWSTSPSSSMTSVAPSVREPTPQVVEDDTDTAAQRVPVVGLVQVEVEADHGARLLLRAVPLNHLGPVGEPTAPVCLDEAATLVAVHVRADQHDVVDDLGGDQLWHGANGIRSRSDRSRPR